MPRPRPAAYAARPLPALDSTPAPWCASRPPRPAPPRPAPPRRAPPRGAATPRSVSARAIAARLTASIWVRIGGKLHYLWRADDQRGVVLDILVQGRRSATAAKRFFKRLLHGLRYKPRRLVTDGLRSDGVAHREVLPEVRHRTSRYLNNQAENSHRPTRRRERQMQRFKSADQAQRFLSAYAMIYGHFRPRRHLMSAAQHRRARATAFQLWRQETCAQTAA